MADVKISQLPVATTPVVGTEVLPIVQSGITAKVSIDNLTAGRAVSMASATVSTGNLAFTGTAQRITGDFSNGAVASRVAFQTSTVNGSTIINALPNGTSAVSRFRAFNAADPTNASFADFGVSSAATIIQSSFGGTGSYLPMGFYTGGAERTSIDTAGNILVGTGTTADTHLKIYGAGTTSSSYTNGDATGATLYLRDSGTTSGNGGQLLFGAGQGIFAGIKGLVTNGTGPAGDLVFQTRTTSGNVTEKIRITDVGNVGIGTSSPLGKVQINAPTGTSFPGSIALAIRDSASPTNGFNFNLEGVTTGDLALTRTVSGTSTAVMSFARATGIVTMQAYGVGTATFSAAGVISSVSDETWKTKDGVPVDPDVMLKKLEPGYWYYNDEKKETFGADRQLGFYAQNVNAAIGPEAAPEPEEGKPWGYYDRSVLAVVVMSLQKALSTIESLEARIAALEAK